MTSKQLPEGWRFLAQKVFGTLVIVSYAGSSGIKIYQHGEVDLSEMPILFNFRLITNDINTIGKLYFGEDWGKE